MENRMHSWHRLNLLLMNYLLLYVLLRVLVFCGGVLYILKECPFNANGCFAWMYACVTHVSPVLAETRSES